MNMIIRRLARSISVNRWNNPVVYFGLSLGILVWIIDAAVDSLIFNDGNIISQIFYPDLFEIYFRATMFSILFISGFFIQFLVRKNKKEEAALRKSEQLFRLLAENARDVIYRVSVAPAFRFEYVSPAIRMLGYTPEEFYADPSLPFILVHPHDRQLLESTIKSPALLISKLLILRWTDKSGNTIWADLSNVPIFDDLGNFIAIEGIARNITQHKQAEAVMKHRLQVEKAVAQVASVLVSKEHVAVSDILAIAGQAVEVNRVTIFNFEAGGKLISNTHEWVASGTTPQIKNLQCLATEELTWWMNKLAHNEIIAISDCSALPGAAIREWELLHKADVHSCLVVPMFYTNEFLGVLGFDDTNSVREWSEDDVRLLRALSEILAAYIQRQHAEKQIRYLAYYDGLTSLNNRSFFEKELKRLDQENQLPLSLIMGDANGLKLLNDAFGHQAGDQLLIKIAGIIKTACGANAIISRWGGDEFAVILPQTSEEGALKTCERIRNACAISAEEPVRPSIALGASTKNEANQNIGEIIKEAENRMYRNKLMEGKNTRRSIISSLQKTLSERTYETDEHAQRLQVLTLEMGRVLGFSYNQLDELSILAILHDIGKIAIPDHILAKPGPLTSEEREIMKRHPEIGFRIAQTSYELAQVAEGILAHHEQWDGNGYPQGLKGNEIPLMSRIIAIIDAYDVMTHERPYKKAFTHQEALAELKQCAGQQFDPNLVDVFVKTISCIETEETASTVNINTALSNS